MIIRLTSLPQRNCKEGLPQLLSLLPTRPNIIQHAMRPLVDLRLRICRLHQREQAPYKRILILQSPNIRIIDNILSVILQRALRSRVRASESAFRESTICEECQREECFDLRLAWYSQEYGGQGDGGCACSFRAGLAVPGHDVFDNGDEAETHLALER